MKVIFSGPKILDALKKYDPQGQDYLLNAVIPGLSFHETERAKLWCARHLRCYEDIVSNKDKCCFCTYSMSIGTVEIYRGSSIKPAKRALIHIANWYNNPSLIGCTFRDLDNPNFIIEFKMHGYKLYNEKARKAREYAEIAATRPILMEAKGDDKMIDVKLRRAAMKAAGVI